MDEEIIALLKIEEKKKDFLRGCKDLGECMSYLITMERILDDEISSLDGQVDEQKLLDELHRYNDVKDMAQSLIGTLAEIQGRTVTEIHKEFDLELVS